MSLDIRTKDGAKALQSQIGEAVRAIAAQHGITLTKNSATYGADGLSLRLGFAPPATEESEKAKWATQAPRFGLPGDRFGATITVGKDDFRVVGIDPKSPAKPVRLSRVTDGAAFKCNVPAAIAAFAKLPTLA